MRIGETSPKQPIENADKPSTPTSPAKMTGAERISQIMSQNSEEAAQNLKQDYDFPPDREYSMNNDLVVHEETINDIATPKRVSKPLPDELKNLISSN